MLNLIVKIITVIAFLVLCVYFLIHFSYASRDKLSSSRKNITGFYAEEDNTVDVLIVGTSSTFSAYMPMRLWTEYGYSAYDFCTNVMMEEVVPYAIKEAMKTQSPKMILIDLAPFLYGHSAENFQENDSHMRYNIDSYKYSSNRRDIIERIVKDKEDRWEYYFDLLYYHQNADVNLAFWNWEMRTPCKGYNNMEEYTPYDSEQEYTEVNTEYELPENEMENLRVLLAVTDQIPNTDVVFLIPPYFGVESENEIVSRAYVLEEYLLAKKEKVLDLHESRDEMGFIPEQDYSMDYLHFHAESAIKITDYLGKWLSKQSILEDHRGDIRYSSWESSVNEWKDYLEKAIEITEMTRRGELRDS